MIAYGARTGSGVSTRSSGDRTDGEIRIIRDRKGRKEIGPGVELASLRASACGLNEVKRERAPGPVSYEDRMFGDCR